MRKEFYLLGKKLPNISQKEINLEFHPYYLKQYNNRWFVFGKNPLFENITNLALDRLIDVEVLDKIFIETDLDFKEYFEDIIGVTFNEKKQATNIILRVDKSLWPYIETKPLHGSQKVIQKGENYVDIKLELIPNYELESLILQHGEKITVLEPSTLSNKIQDRIQQLIKKYKCAE